jgi:putative spermidine/putrescine transport system substrate-binding protein
MALAASSFAAAAHAAEPLRVLAWVGYADPDIVKTFEQRYQCKVEVTTIYSDVDLWQKVSHNNGQDFDLFAVNTAELQRYIRMDLVQGIPTAAVPNLAKQLPRFRDLRAIPGLVHGSTVYAVPYTYAEMGLIYDRKQIPRAPNSITALWDPRYKGKVVAYNGGTHNFSLAAIALGLKKPFQLSSTDWPAAVDQLIALRRNVTGFYIDPDESVDLFRSRKASLMFANYGRQQLQLLQAAGVDVGYVIPKEGALAWLDCWTITRGARNRTLAAAWINYMLEPEPGQALRSRHGLDNTTSAGPEDSPEDRLLWLEPVDSEDRRNLLWARILAGDRASKVLAP